MYVQVAVKEVLMSVGVFMNKISAEKKIGVGKVVLRLAIGNDAVFSPHDNNAVGDFLH